MGPICTSWTGIRGLAADLTVIDAESWTELTRLERGQGGSLRDVDLNSEESHAATAGFDNFVRIWDLASESIVEEIEVEGNLPTGLTDVEFLTDAILLVVASDFHEVLVFTIDTSELISFAKARITRGFTEQECATYGIDPCPTLDEIKST